MRRLFVLLLLIGLINCTGEKLHPYTIHIITKRLPDAGDAIIHPVIIKASHASDSLAYRDGAAAFVIEYQRMVDRMNRGEKAFTRPVNFIVYNKEGKDIKGNISKAYQARLFRFIKRKCGETR